MLFLFEPLMQSEADLATIQLKLTLLLGSTTIVYLFCRNNIFPPEFMLLLHYSIYRVTGKECNLEHLSMFLVK